VGFRQGVIKLLDQFDQNAVAKRIAADHFGVVLLVIAEDFDTDLGGVLDNVVIGNDQAALVDDEANANAKGFLRLRALTAAPALPGNALAAAAVGTAEEAAEELVAPEEVGRLLRAPRRRGADADDNRTLRLGDVAEGL